MDDIVYKCRVKGEEKWEEFSEHPYRNLNVVASLFGQSKNLENKTLVEIRDGKEIKEFIYDLTKNN